MTVAMPFRMSIAALLMTTGAMTGALTGVPALAQSGEPNPAGAEVRMVVTAADHVSHKPPALKASDVTIMGGTVTDWVALSGSHGDLDLYLLIDDTANYDFGSKLKELRQFIASQPAAVAVGVAYIHDGALQIAESPTRDHARALRALRVPAGSRTANPYCAISDLIDGWTRKSLRREILLVSTGIDDSAAERATCVNAEMAIHDAERAGVEIYAIYNPVANYVSEKWSKVDSGVINLAHVCYETGGEAYFLSHNPVESIVPFLDDIAEHLAHQYLVTFRMDPELGNGFRPVYAIPVPMNVELMVPESVWVPAPAGAPAP